MATLVLTAVGTAVGGPIGGALGALVGQSVDRAVLAPGGRREGPRLTELKLQTSSYGTPIPSLFGTMRVAGTVIWSTDLIETWATSKAGKGQPSVTNYSYSASFAVLLSARAICGVGRIWAEGKLLRGAAGDWKGQTGFRLHLGGEDQAPDPLIASAVGVGMAPAHRGCAYAVFEGFQLADYGNRIPSLTFEVIADEGGVAPGAIARALVAEAAVATDDESGAPVAGFAATGDARGALDLLAQIGGGWWAAEGGRVLLRRGAGEAIEVADAGWSADEGAPRRGRTLAPLGTVARTLSIAHYDPGRDWQAGLQRARRPGAGTRDERVEVPAALDAGAAKALAEAMLLRREAERARRTVALPLGGLAIGPGQRVTVAGEAGSWRVTETAVEGLATRLTLVPLAAAPVASGEADSGRVVGAADEPVGPTLLDAFELPPLDDVALAAPRLTVVAAGAGTGWRRAALLLSLDEGASWQSAGASAAPAVMGKVVVGPGAGPTTLVDDMGVLEVALGHPGMMLADADDAQLDSGANLALVGEELIQFGRAVPLGGTRWRLSRLLRGRRGTEAAIGGQSAGDRFVVLEGDAARTLDLPLAALGTTARVMATGVGDVDGPVTAAVAITGASVRPPAPVALVVERRGDGGAALHWTRRSRLGWRWLDGTDAPLGEEAERYRITLTLAGGATRQAETTTPSLELAAGDLAGGPVTARVRQVGIYGESDGAEIVVRGAGERGETRA